MDFDENRVHHIISGGLAHNKYYKIYVTQVNTYGMESPRSDPVTLRVGDVVPPPCPKLELDTSKDHPKGYYQNGEDMDVMFKWNDVSGDCDDFSHYLWYKTTNFPDFKKNGEYTDEQCKSATVGRSGWIPPTVHTATLDGCSPNVPIYVGIRSVDLSGNQSNIYVIKVNPKQDPMVVPNPKIAPVAEPVGIWSIRVSVECPNYDTVQYVQFYRDGEKGIALPPVLFHPGCIVEYVDYLDAISALNHFYTYKYIGKNGKHSKMSPKSATVRAKHLDFSEIEKSIKKELQEMWQTDDTKNKKALEEAAAKQLKQIQANAKAIKNATETINKTTKSVTLLTSELNTISAKVDEQIDEATVDGKINKKITALQTQITQNAEAIKLKAQKVELDGANKKIYSIQSQLKVQANKISSIISDTEGYVSSITQLRDAIDLKVSMDDVMARITVAVQQGISVASIEADRIVLKGQMLMEGDARLCGRFYSSDIALVDSESNQVFWGAGSGTIKPVVTNTRWSWEKVTQVGAGRGLDANFPWTRFGAVKFTPKPRLNFNGFCRVKITSELDVGYVCPNGFDNVVATNDGKGRTVWGINTSDEGTFASTAEHPQLRLEASGDWQTKDNIIYKHINLDMERYMRIGTQSEIGLWVMCDYGDARRLRDVKVAAANWVLRIEVS